MSLNLVSDDANQAVYTVVKVERVLHGESPELTAMAVVDEVVKQLELDCEQRNLLAQWCLLKHGC